MTQIISPQPMTTLPPTVGAHTAPPVVVARSVDVMSPAEAQFWQEWAAKAPALIRQKVAANSSELSAALMPYKMGGVALGAALGAATFTKTIPGKWKWLSGMASIASLTVGALAGFGHSETKKMDQLFLGYADALDKDPALRQNLANFMSSTVTADMAECGMENVVLERVAMLASQMPHLQTSAQQCVRTR